MPAHKRQVPKSWSRGGYAPAMREADAPTEFDQVANRLGLTEDTWHQSMKLRDWIHRNCDFRYVPESLLKKTWDHSERYGNE